MNYDSDIAKGNTDRDFDEMNPFADQELDNIQKKSTIWKTWRD